MRSPNSASSSNTRAVGVPSRKVPDVMSSDDQSSRDVKDTLRLARVAMPALAAAGLFTAICFWDVSPGGTMVVLLAALLVPVVGAFAAAVAFENRGISPLSSVMARGAAGGLACVIGCAWGAVPLMLFPACDGAHKLILVPLMGAVLTVITLLGPMTSICLLFGAPIVVGSLVALAVSGDADAMPLCALLVASAVYLAVSRASLQAVEADRLSDLSRGGADRHAAEAMQPASDEVEGRWRFELDEQGRLRSVSEALAAAVGVARLQLEGAPLRSLLVARLPNTQMSASARILVDQVAVRRAFDGDEVEIKTAERSLWWRFAGKPMHHVGGGFAGYRGTCVDVTTTHEDEARIGFLTTRDALTGATNRETLLAAMAEACAAASTDAARQAFVLLDLDGFRAVNDGFGHAAGDTVLQQVAVRLASLAPPSAIVARLGDDEFGVLCQTANCAAAESLARHLIEGLSVAMATSEGEVTVGASAGVAVMPDHAADAAGLLAKAEVALRRAKTNGRGSHRLFVAAYEDQLAARRELEDDVALAVARREFILHYQPLVDLASGRVTSFEALIRWASPTRGFVSPASFIPTAEATGLIVPIGRWVLAEACMEAARWDPAVGIAVNISPRHFRSPDFVQEVVATLAASGLHPSRLEIEITESVFLEQSDVAMANLQALRRRGVRVALDDFGTGYSSLSYLINFPVDRIKIDRSFVQDLVHRRASRAIIEAILTLAKQLSIRVTAEGVETVDQALALKMLRCDTIQGYLLSKPRPAVEVEGLIATVPKLFETLIPMLFDSPLALALALKKQGGDQRAERRDAMAGPARR